MIIRFRSCATFLGFAVGIQTVTLLTIGFGYHPSSSSSFLHRFNNVDDNHPPTSITETRKRDETRKSTNNNNQKVPLVVGGSDGSGTRAVVDILQRQFGISMIIDDPGTLDFHARDSWNHQGWPPFGHAALSLQQSHSNGSFGLLYNNDDDAIPENVTKELQQMRKQLDLRYEQYERMTRRTATTQTSTKISYGFKAPITLILLPWIQKVLYPDTGFKFLHIVRDGRDVALSGNQSPVLQFYRDFYGADTTTSMIQKYRNTLHVLAMQLWNDWNVQTYQWMMQQPKFDFLVLRTEDLCLKQNPHVLQELANFLGATIRDDVVCCGFQTRDMGRSGMTGQESISKEQLTKRQAQRKAFFQELATLKHKTVEDLSQEERLEFIQQVHHQRRGEELTTNHNKRNNTNSNSTVATTRLIAPLSQRQERHDAFRNKQKERRALLRNSSATIYHQDEESHHRRRLDEEKDDDYVKNLDQLMVHQLQELKGNATTKSLDTGNIEQVSSRYGKWSALLGNAPALSKYLHEKGAVGLELFGYEPPRPMWMSSSQENNNVFVDYDQLCRTLVCEKQLEW